MSQRQISASSALLKAHWESVCWALLKQQWLGRWARVTMSLCLFWDQLRQYSQVPANLSLPAPRTRTFFICQIYKPVLPSAFQTYSTNFILLSTSINPTFFFICVNWFLVLLETGPTFRPKTSSTSFIRTRFCLVVMIHSFQWYNTSWLCLSVCVNTVFVSV